MREASYVIFLFYELAIMSNFVSDKLYSYQRAAVRKIERVFEISQTVGLSETSLSNSTTRLHGKT